MRATLIIASPDAGVVCPTFGLMFVGLYLILRLIGVLTFRKPRESETTRQVGFDVMFREDELSRQRREAGLCVACGYSLAGNQSGVCPECGAGIKGR